MKRRTRRRIVLAWKYRRTIIGAVRRRNWRQARIWLGFRNTNQTEGA